MAKDGGFPKVEVRFGLDQEMYGILMNHVPKAYGPNHHQKAKRILEKWLLEYFEEERKAGRLRQKPE